jgi:hypothetical protein
MIEESDPLGLLAVDGLGTEISMDTRSMVVDIWEPRTAVETRTPVASEEPAMVCGEGLNWPLPSLGTSS